MTLRVSIYISGPGNAHAFLKTDNPDAALKFLRDHDAEGAQVSLLVQCEDADAYRLLLTLSPQSLT